MSAVRSPCSRLGLASLGLILSALAFGQSLSIVSPSNISSLTSGNATGRLTDDYSNDQPSRANYIWEDQQDPFGPGAVPSALDGIGMIHTKAEDADTAGASTVVSFAVSTNTQVIVWHDDSETSKPSWLTSGFADCGLDIIDSTGTYSAWAATRTGTVNLGGNCPTGGCAAEPSMYFVSYVPAWRPICEAEQADGGGDPEAPGALRFTSAGYSGNESSTLTFMVERAGGTDGPASITIAEGSNPGNGTLNTTSLSWLDDEGGSKSGTVTLADVGPGNETMTLTLSGATGAILGSPSTATLTIFDLDSPTSSADVLVNPNGTCSDSYDGTSFTYVSGSTGPWCTISRANAAPSGSTIGIASATYRNDPIIPQSPNLTYQPEDGSFTLMGPTSGSMSYAVNCNQPGLRVLSNGSYEARYDGEAEWGTGGGQVEKGENPSSIARITQGGRIDNNCDNATIQITGQNTAGWNGWTLGSGVTGLKFQVQFPVGTHGSVAVGASDDFGDLTWVNTDYPNRIWMDGCEFSAGLTYKHGGHSLARFGDAKNLVGCTAWDNRWQAVPTWSSPDGNRTFVLTENAQNSTFYDIIINGGGYSPDNGTVGCIKHQGTRNALVVGVMRNCHQFGHNMTALDSGRYARGLRAYHMVYQNIGDVIAYLRMYTEETCGGCSAWRELDDIKFKNIVSLGHSSNDIIFELQSRQGQIYCGDDEAGRPCNDIVQQDWDDIFFLDGALFEVPGGNCSSLRVTARGDGTQTLQWFITNYPANFTNVRCTADAGYGNAPAAGTSTTFANYETHWTPTDGEHVNGQGSDITTAAGGGISSTNLCVNDIVGFSDPDGDAISTAAGQLGSFGAWMVNLNGVNVEYTNLSFSGAYPTVSGCFTLASPQTWPNNAPVNFPISSGSSPNLGGVL